MKKSYSVFPILLFSLLALVIVFPLLPPGYILTMDAAFTPKMPWPQITSSSFLYESLLSLLTLLFPSYWVEKVIIFLIFFFSGWGMYRLISANNILVRIFGGVFYAVNPFTYERLMSGQLGFLLGYSLFPFVVSATFDFFSGMSKREALKLAILTTLMITTAIHYALIFAVFFLIYGAVFVFFNRELSTPFKPLIIFFGFLFILNSNWIVSSIFGASSISQAVNVYTSDDLVAFQSVADKNFGLIFNLLSGYGFWAETYDYFILPKNIIFFWPIIAICFIGISLYGLVKIIINRRIHNIIFVVTLIIMFFLALDFAGGIALKSFAPVVFTLYEKIPLLWAFREPQKLVGIIMLCYAYFGSIGLSYILDTLKNKTRYIILLMFLILPFIYTPTVFGGFWGQLKPVFYPASWQTVDQVLKEDKDNFLTLFLPWHQYMRFNFTNDRVVANPAPYYFEKPILSSQNYETSYLYTHDIRTESLHVEGLLSIEKERENLLGEKVYERINWAEDLSVIDVKYIILAKDDDWKRYSFLERSKDLEKVYDNDEIALYSNKSFGKEPIVLEFSDENIDEMGSIDNE